MKTEFVQPPTALNKPPIVDPRGESLTASELKTAQKLNEKYAITLYTSVCYQSNVGGLSAMTKENKPRFTSDSLNTACTCMANRLLKDVGPSDIIGYMTSTYGAAPQGSKNLAQDLGFEAKMADRKVQKGTHIAPPGMVGTRTNPVVTAFSKIARINGNVDERKKCGLSP